MNYIKYVLSNGLRVILVPQAESLSATVMVLVEVGSLYEAKATNGAAHFLEHLCFKGTTKRPTPSGIAEDLEALGARYNAFTDHEFTGYHATVQADKLRPAFDIVADMYLHPLLPPAEIEKEKGVIIEEINMYEDLPTRKIYDLAREVLYGDQPAGWDIAGTKANVAGFRREVISEFRAKHYVSEGTVVIVAGRFKEKEVRTWIKDNFGALPRAARPGRAAVRDTLGEPASRLLTKKSDQSHLMVVFRSVNLAHPDYYVYQVLAAVLGGGMSSRLFKKIRDELGAAYYIYALNDSGTDHGYFGIPCGTGHKETEKVISAIAAECRRLKEGLVDEVELKRVKDFLVGNLMLSLETSRELAAYYGGFEILRRPLLRPEEEATRLQGVTASDLRRVARELFVAAKVNLALIGPHDNPAPFVRALAL